MGRGREGGMEGGMEGGRDGGREGGREGGRDMEVSISVPQEWCVCVSFSNFMCRGCVKYVNENGIERDDFD